MQINERSTSRERSLCALPRHFYQSNRRKLCKWPYLSNASSIASASSATSSGGVGGIRPPGSVALQVPNNSGSPFSQAAVPTAASGGQQLPHQLQQLNFRPASSAGQLPPSLTVARTSINTAASLQVGVYSVSDVGKKVNKRLPIRPLVHIYFKVDRIKRTQNSQYILW